MVEREPYLTPLKKFREDRMNFKDKLKANWILSSPLEKLLYVFGTLSLFYTIIRIILQGLW